MVRLSCFCWLLKCCSFDEEKREGIVLAFIQLFCPTYGTVLEKDKDKYYSSFARAPPTPLTMRRFSLLLSLEDAQKVRLDGTIDPRYGPFSRATFLWNYNPSHQVRFCLFTEHAKRPI